MRSNYLFTSESVSEGHPDKVSDQISDAIVDLMLSKDPESRVACETLTTTDRIVLAGEIRCKPMYDESRSDWADNDYWAPGAGEPAKARNINAALARSSRAKGRRNQTPKKTPVFAASQAQAAK